MRLFPVCITTLSAVYCGSCLSVQLPRTHSTVIQTGKGVSIDDDGGCLCFYLQYKDISFLRQTKEIKLNNLETSEVPACWSAYSIRVSWSLYTGIGPLISGLNNNQRLGSLLCKFKNKRKKKSKQRLNRFIVKLYIPPTTIAILIII